MNKKIEPAPVTDNSAPIEIGPRGNVKGNHFYNGLTWKRVKGKLKVKGERNYHQGSIMEYTPWGWQKHKEEERKKLSAL